jgi:hypothetical protein
VEAHRHYFLELHRLKFGVSWCVSDGADPPGEQLHPSTIRSMSTEELP